MKQLIVITGAGGGIGRGLSLCLAAQGHAIIATDLQADSARETADQVKAAGGEAEPFGLDLTNEEAVLSFWEGLAGRPVSVLINNAGLQQVARVDEFPTAKWDLLINVLLRGTFLMTRSVLPGMRERGFGRIIHIGSIHSLVASPCKSAYVSAKHALLGFSKTLALETAGTDITSNTICPSYVHTPLVDAQIKDQARVRGISEEDVIQRIMLEPMPKKVFITFEEIAGAVEFFMSAAARNVTGQDLAIDGGWTAQ
ncbi:3-hydroxybutyrate dehydrogenase [Verrucomicrobium sp. BvORR034]|uniref:3-hydroxybutyrate dehydrogenase n=1 Tax=Verrucomicrobium sp. BvORR034 TaxID=1396418 RepID=UPI000678CA3C|nr:3-hydroxybutyrate dehydrogenase [Verrucomicrobium sp. BvORR034]